jgi:hypothetical protein
MSFYSVHVSIVYTYSKHAHVSFKFILHCRYTELILKAAQFGENDRLFHVIRTMTFLSLRFYF